MKSKDLERALDSRPDNPPQAVALLQQGLKSRYASIVVKAVRRLQEWEVEIAVDDLLATYSRFLVDAVKRDPACRAKTALLKALREAGGADHSFFLEACRYRQMEPVFGGSEDTAVELRGLAALALAESGWLHAGEHLLPCLLDPEAPTRVSGVRALAILGETLVLRFKALQGDEEPAVVGECLEWLLALEKERAVPFVADFLSASEELCELAALALGASRCATALPPLLAAWETRPELRSTFLVALATLRNPQADAFLQALVDKEAPGLEVLAPFGFARRSAEAADHGP